MVRCLLSVPRSSHYEMEGLLKFSLGPLKFNFVTGTGWCGPSTLCPFFFNSFRKTFLREKTSKDSPLLDQLTKHFLMKTIIFLVDCRCDQGIAVFRNLTHKMVSHE